MTGFANILFLTGLPFLLWRHEKQKGERCSSPTSAATMLSRLCHLLQPVSSIGKVISAGTWGLATPFKKSWVHTVWAEGADEWVPALLCTIMFGSGNIAGLCSCWKAACKAWRERWEANELWLGSFLSPLEIASRIGYANIRKERVKRFNAAPSSFSITLMSTHRQLTVESNYMVLERQYSHFQEKVTCSLCYAIYIAVAIILEQEQHRLFLDLLKWGCVTMCSLGLVPMYVCMGL